MNCKKYFQSKAIAGAFSAFAVASIVSASAFAGSGPYVFIDIEDGEVVKFYTDGAAIPSSVTGNIEVESSFGGLPDVESVTVNADGGADVDATLIDQYEFRTGVALWSANVSAVPDTNPFDTTITAIGSVPAYYDEHAAYTVTDSVTITLQFLDTSTVDTNDDGDPIPDLDAVDIVLANGGTVTSTTSSGNLVVSNLSSAPGSVGTADGFPFTLPGGQNAFLSIDVPEVTGGGFFNVVAMATIASSAEDLAGGGAPSVGITVPVDSTEQGVYVRLVVLTQLLVADPYVVFDGELSDLFGTGDITLSLEIQDATATTTANAFQFDATYDAMTNTFSATGDESWTEVDPAISFAGRATVTTGVVSVVLDKSGTVIGFTGDGGESLSGGGSSSTCFIATAAYGTPMATEIDTLRSVRDTYMLNNVVGSAFVDTYYRLSPAVADKVAESPVLAAAVRAILTPLVLLGKLILAAPMALVGLMLAGAGLALTSRRARGQQS